ncbi:MAG TPA: peptidoglycan-binding protein [Thiobacillaceae bacterium]|nr:peptidoglycan-binding protein [Thiobacillaceae bacterium]HNU63335.1 peptidoglycan-binding protein [Thiobacillaceae bacterium]
METLRFGARGKEVERLQKRLLRLGFPPGNIDGDFGLGTEAAVLAFQRGKGLLADGVAGPRTLKALGLTEDDTLASVIPRITPQLVSRLFPFTFIGNIKVHLPFVLAGLEAHGLVDRPMVLMALATIRAESEGFVPVSEDRSRFNTSPNGHPFDLYDKRRDLGNRGRPDGERYRGRGFVQLTGRDNYARHGRQMGLKLLEQPDLACQPDIAGQLLGSFLRDKEREIKQALVADDLRVARRAVNGGSHGLDRFSDTYLRGLELLPDMP